MKFESCIQGFPHWSQTVSWILGNEPPRGLIRPWGQAGLWPLAGRPTEQGTAQGACCLSRPCAPYFQGYFMLRVRLSCTFLFPGDILTSPTPPTVNHLPVLVWHEGILGNMPRLSIPSMSCLASVTFTTRWLCLLNPSFLSGQLLPPVQATLLEATYQAPPPPASPPPPPGLPC